MSIRLGQFLFDGPFENADPLENRPGVYAALHWRDGKYQVLDVHESSHVKKHATSPVLYQLWADTCGSDPTIHYAVLYTTRDETGRREMERVLRKFYDPPCPEGVKRDRSND